MYYSPVEIEKADHCECGLQHALRCRKLLCALRHGVARSRALKDVAIFQQGAIADSVFYIDAGRVKITVLSGQGKEAVVAMLGAGDFFGEGCLTGQVVRMASVVTMTECDIVRIEKRP